MRKLTDKKGFTLIEMIMVLIIMGIAGISLVNIIIYSMQSYIFARNADQLSQKAQLAMARIKVELINASEVSVASASQITFKLPQSAAPPSCTTTTGCQYTILLSDNQVTLRDVTNSGAAQVLIDGLTASNNGNSFLSYYQSDGSTAWTTTNGFSELGTIQVIISLDNKTGSGTIPVKYVGSINPRANTILIAPTPN
jgi:prepilin-type N-terminal cleavage/methylation domain-containing protein